MLLSLASSPSFPSCERPTFSSPNHRISTAIHIIATATKTNSEDSRYKVRRHCSSIGPKLNRCFQLKLSVSSVLFSPLLCMRACSLLHVCAVARPGLLRRQHRSRLLSPTHLLAGEVEGQQSVLSVHPAQACTRPSGATEIRQQSGRGIELRQ